MGATERDGLVKYLVFFLDGDVAKRILVSVYWRGICSSRFPVRLCYHEKAIPDSCIMIYSLI